jgi:hypothetical protein
MQASNYRVSEMSLSSLWKRVDSLFGELGLRKVRMVAASLEHGNGAVGTLAV